LLSLTRKPTSKCAHFKRGSASPALKERKAGRVSTLLATHSERARAGGQARPPRAALPLCCSPRTVNCRPHTPALRHGSAIAREQLSRASLRARAPRRAGSARPGRAGRGVRSVCRILRVRCRPSAMLAGSRTAQSCLGAARRTWRGAHANGRLVECGRISRCETGSSACVCVLLCPTAVSSKHRAAECIGFAFVPVLSCRRATQIQRPVLLGSRRSPRGASLFWKRRGPRGFGNGVCSGAGLPVARGTESMVELLTAY